MPENFGMKRNYYLILVFLIISVGSCKKLTEFHIEDSTTIIIPQTTPVGVPLLDTATIKSSSSCQFQANGTDAKHVKEIRLEKLSLAITDPPGKTFSFLSSIHISIIADGLSEIEVAYLDNIPSNVGSSIDLITTGAVLDDYLKKDSYSLKVKTVTNQLLTQSVTIKADMIFFVKAKLI